MARDDDLRQQFDRVGEYIEAGGEDVIVAIRTPFGTEALDPFAETVIPAFT